MAAANIVGGYLGARLAMARGARFVRVFFLLVVSGFVVRLGGGPARLVVTGSLHLVGAVSAVDGFQRRHPVLGFPLAVVYKYFDDQGPYLASALTYYAFIAIFPLMLLGHLDPRPHPARRAQLAGGDPRLRARAVPDHRRRARPPAGPPGIVAGVAVGAIAALYGAMGLGQALQNTQHVAWSVPRNSRPNPIYARVKTLVPARHGRLLAARGVDRLHHREHHRPVHRDARWRA